jgi:thioredoxin 1
MEEVAGACNGSAKVFKVDVDDNPDLGTQYAIQFVPMLICFINGAIRMKIVGTASAKAILAKLRLHALGCQPNGQPREQNQPQNGGET